MTLRGPDHPEQIADSVLSDAGSNATGYSKKLDARDISELSIHIVWAETVATFAGAFTLWGSNILEPGEGNDDDWVEQTADHGWCGFPGGDPTGGDGKDSRDISGANMLWYRLKFVNATGEGNWDAHMLRKGEENA